MPSERDVRDKLSGKNVSNALGARATCPSASLRGALWLSVIVALVSLMFVTLDNIVTLADAGGDLDVGSWPRLLLAVSAIAAGALFDIRQRRYMNFIMFCVLLLSTIAILAAETSSGLFWGLVLFYLASGFFVTYFTASFMLMAPKTRRPALWKWAARSETYALRDCGPSLALIRWGNIVLMTAVCIVFVRGDYRCVFRVGGISLGRGLKRRRVLRSTWRRSRRNTA